MIYIEEVCFLPQFGRIVIYILPFMNHERRHRPSFSQAIHTSHNIGDGVVVRPPPAIQCYIYIYCTFPSHSLHSRLLDSYEWRDHVALPHTCPHATHSLTRVCKPKATTTSSTRELLTGVGFQWGVQVHVIICLNTTWLYVAIDSNVESNCADLKN